MLVGSVVFLELLLNEIDLAEEHVEGDKHCQPSPEDQLENQDHREVDVAVAEVGEHVDDAVVPEGQVVEGCEIEKKILVNRVRFNECRAAPRRASLT